MDEAAVHEMMASELISRGILTAEQIASEGAVGSPGKLDAGRSTLEADIVETVDDLPDELGSAFAPATNIAEYNYSGPSPQTQLTPDEVRMTGDWLIKGQFPPGIGTQLVKEA